MSNVANLINRSLKLINALEEGESPSNEMQADALDSLNDMLNAWNDKGIGVDAGDLTLTEDFPVDGNERRAIRYNLAVELAPEYGSNVSPFVYETAKDSYRWMQAKYTSISEVKFDTSLQSEKWYDIDSGPDYYRHR